MPDRWIRFDKGTDTGISSNLSLLSMTADEGVSSLPRYDVIAEISNETGFSFYETTGKPVVIRWARDDNAKHDRLFEGIVVDLEDIESSESPKVEVQVGSWLSVQAPLPSSNASAVPMVRLEIRPWLWLLTQNVQCRIYQDVTVLKIIEDLIRTQLTSKISSGNYRFDVSGVKGTYAERNYSVQYNESDFAFLSRILEDEGIYYYYGPDGVLYFADDSLTAPSLEKYFPPTSATAPSSDLPSAPAFNTASGPIRRWRRSQRYKTANCEVSDVNGQAPADACIGSQAWTTQLLLNDATVELPRITKLVATEASAGFAKQIDIVSQSGNADAQGFSPVGQLVRDLADKVAKRRAEEAGCAAYRIEGGGDYSFFHPGLAFQPTELLSKGISGSFLLLGVRHEISTSSIRATGSAADTRSYSNSFVCIPRNVAFRPPRLTPKPKMIGTQTALVVGLTEDATTCTDVLGRILVEFYWTKSKGSASARLKVFDPTQCSAWVRWSQPWAGSSFGVQAFPRVGHEVVISFQDGDPDQPIGVGSVSNAKNRPPFHPKDCPNASGIKTQTIGGDSNAFNGLRFDDSPGKEITQLRGQRDILVDSKNKIALYAKDSLIEMSPRQFTVVGDQANIVGLTPTSVIRQARDLFVTRDNEGKASTTDELADNLFPGGWSPLFPPVETSGTRVNLATGTEVQFCYDYSIISTGQRHDFAGIPMPYLYALAQLLNAFGGAAMAAGKSGMMMTIFKKIWKLFGQGIGKLEYTAGPRTDIVSSFALSIYRGGRYEYVGNMEWPQFPPAAVFIKCAWPVYTIHTMFITPFLIEENPNNAVETAKTCSYVSRAIPFIILNIEHLLAGITAAKRVLATAAEIGKVVTKEFSAGALSFSHALTGISKLTHALAKATDVLDDSNSYFEVLGSHHTHVGKCMGIHAETGLSLESKSIIGVGKEVSFHAGDSGLILGDLASALKLYSGLFSLKYSLLGGLELSVGPQASISINPMGMISIKGTKIDIEAGVSSISIDPMQVSTTAMTIDTNAMMAISGKSPQRKQTV